MTILTAHQPVFLPWLGFFSKVSKADLFCSFDAVEYSPRSFENRNYIKTPNGPVMLTVPVTHKAGDRCCDVEIAAGPWARKHMRSIELAYKKATFFEQHFAGVGAIIDLYAEGGLLAELNMDLMRYFLRALGIQIPIVKASDYGFEGEKSDLVLDMCRKLKATTYIFGGEGQSYADTAAFSAAGVLCQFERYEHPTYRQQHGTFVPRLSTLDLLMNEGPASAGILLAAETVA